MLYFIPAWYQQNTWNENEQIWYVRRTQTEFDDTVKQIQLFHRNNVYPYQIMLMSFAPNFRHFLHRQGIFHAPYWSCFDSIQEIRRKKVSVLSFHQLNWPKNIEFVYTPFVIIAICKKNKYAQIEFGEDGNPIQIDLYENDRICRRNIYDDRGFVSSTIVYEEGEPYYQDYLMENGGWKLRRFQKDGHVEINPKYPKYLVSYSKTEQLVRFSRLSYNSIEQVLYEVLSTYLGMTKRTDIFCVAMHTHHTALLKKALSGRNMILSFFAHRYSINNDPESADMLEKADYIITDSRENLKKIRWEVGESIKNIMVITPYDSRVAFGVSQQFAFQKILLPVDDLDDEIFEKLIEILGRYLLKNDIAQIHLLTRKADYDRKEQLMKCIRDTLERTDLQKAQPTDGAENEGTDYSQEIVGMISAKFFVEQCIDELAVSKCMREQRLLVDMRNVPELYLQITAISVGIPQIVRMRTEFVEHGRNGIVLKELKKLPEALDYYLVGLSNWNEAMVYSYEIGKEYTTDKLLVRWKEVIDSVG